MYDFAALTVCTPHIPCFCVQAKADLQRVQGELQSLRGSTEVSAVFIFTHFGLLSFLPPLSTPHLPPSPPSAQMFPVKISPTFFQ